MMTRWFGSVVFFVAAALSDHWFPTMVMVFLACRELDADIYEWSCKHRYDRYSDENKGDCA